MKKMNCTKDFSVSAIPPKNIVSQDDKLLIASNIELKVITCKKRLSKGDLNETNSEVATSVRPCQLAKMPLPIQQLKQETFTSKVSLKKDISSAKDEKLSLSLSQQVIPFKANDVTSCRLGSNYILGKSNKKSLLTKVPNICNEKFSHDGEDCENHLISPSSRWLSQPKSYRGAKRDGNSQRKLIRKVPSFIDTTDGETSGMGSSVDEPIESSTESASEAPPSFLQPRLSSRPPTTSPSALKKRRGGWPKGRKRKPELPGTKPPKAPLTAYVLFLNERRKFYKETQPHLPFAEVTKLLGAEWSSMTAVQKVVYVNRSEQDKRRYRNELQSYRQSHDYQLLLRKKRIKNAMHKGATTTEESSDFTDEIDDDDSEELYCRTCDQWFSSLHNKREHLYGRHHLQAITGEYQREREAEEKREEALPQGSKEAPSSHNDDETRTSVNSVSCIASTTEDDPDDDDDGDDYDEEREYDGEEEATEEEGAEAGAERWKDHDVGRVTDAAERVISKVLGREKEIMFLRRRFEKARRTQQKLAASLVALQARQRLLQEEQQRLQEEEEELQQKAYNLMKLTRLDNQTTMDVKHLVSGFSSRGIPKPVEKLAVTSTVDESKNEESFGSRKVCDLSLGKSDQTDTEQAPEATVSKDNLVRGECDTSRNLLTRPEVEHSYSKRSNLLDCLKGETGPGFEGDCNDSIITVEGSKNQKQNINLTLPDTSTNLELDNTDLQKSTLKDESRKSDQLPLLENTIKNIWSYTADTTKCLDQGETLAYPDSNELFNYGLDNYFIQEDVFFRQLNLHLDPGELSDLHWEDTAAPGSRSSHLSSLDNILEDDDLIKLMENDT